MIKINNTEARQGVEPLSPEDLTKLVNFYNFDFDKFPPNYEPVVYTQRLIDSYQNLQHFWDVVGGWEGYNKLLTTGNP